MMDYIANCRKSMRELMNGGPDSELVNVRLRTTDGVEIIALTVNEYTLVTLQNCTGEEWDYGDEDAGGAAPAEG